MKSRISGKEIRSEFKTYMHKGKEYICAEDTFHLALMHYLRLTDEEYDLLLSEISDEQSDMLMNENPTFAEKRQVLTIINKIFRDGK